MVAAKLRPMVNTALSAGAAAVLVNNCPKIGLALPCQLDSAAAMTLAVHPPFPTPSLLDPRLMLMVAHDQRAAMTVLWQLDARLFAVVTGRRDDMLAQLKLAWWRDRLRQLADAPDDLPRGEPLLRDLALHWGQFNSLVDFADGYEASMLATTVAEAREAAAGLASAMHKALARLGGAEAPEAWALVRSAQMLPGRAIAGALWREAGALPADVQKIRALRTLARWAQLVARHDGAASARSEGWLLLRAGLCF